MALNKKLTPLLAGRMVKTVRYEDDTLSVIFADDSTMKIKTGAPGAYDSLPGRTIKAVRQRNDVMNIDFNDGSTVKIKLAAATSSVMLRNGSGKLEYAD